MTKPEETVHTGFSESKKIKFLEGFDKIFDIICNINQKERKKELKFVIEIEYSFYKTK